MVGKNLNKSIANKINLLNKQNQNNYEKYIKELKTEVKLKDFLLDKISNLREEEESLTLYLGKLVAYQTVLNYMEELEDEQ